MGNYLSVSDFVALAGMPCKWQERDLQNYLAKCLRKKRIKVQLEVKCRGGRADIVTPSTIYEVKKWLTRSEIYQAKGQLECYRNSLKGFGGRLKKGVVIGFMPNRNSEEIKAAQTTAWFVSQNSDIEVVFVNQTEEWFPSQSKKWQRYIPLERLKLSLNLGDALRKANLGKFGDIVIAAGIALILLAILIAQSPKQQQYNQTGEKDALDAGN